MIKKHPYRLINISGYERDLNKKYFHPLSIILTLYFSWKGKKIIHVLLNKSEPFFDVQKFQDSNLINLNFNIDDIEKLSEFQKQSYLIDFFIEAFKKLKIDYPSFTVPESEKFKKKFNSNNNYFIKTICEKSNKKFEVEILLFLGFNDFSIVCNVVDKITSSEVSLILIRILPNLVRLNHIIGDLKWISKKEDKLVYNCSHSKLQFHIDLAEKDYGITTNGQKEGLKQLINQIGKNFKERAFLRSRIIT